MPSVGSEVTAEIQHEARHRFVYRKRFHKVRNRLTIPRAFTAADHGGARPGASDAGRDGRHRFVAGQRVLQAASTAAVDPVRLRAPRCQFRATSTAAPPATPGTSPGCPGTEPLLIRRIDAESLAATSPRQAAGRRGECRASMTLDAISMPEVVQMPGLAIAQVEHRVDSGTSNSPPRLGGLRTAWRLRLRMNDVAAAGECWPMTVDALADELQYRQTRTRRYGDQRCRQLRRTGSSCGCVTAARALRCSPPTLLPQPRPRRGLPAEVLGPDASPTMPPPRLRQNAGRAGRPAASPELSAREADRLAPRLGHQAAEAELRRWPPRCTTSR